jgi:hypothetical protein
MEYDRCGFLFRVAVLVVAVKAVFSTAPDIIQPSVPTYSVAQGNTLSLQCEDRDGDTIVWTRDGIILYNNVNGYSIRDYTVTVNRRPVRKLELQKSTVTVDDAGTYQCRQPTTGETDSITISIFTGCHSDPCQNRATCTPNIGQLFTCDCLPGYIGDRCETDVDECASLPCQNGATCRQNAPDSYACDCAPGYTGLNCQTEVNLCSPNTCQNAVRVSRVWVR